MKVWKVSSWLRMSLTGRPASLEAATTTASSRSPLQLQPEGEGGLAVGPHRDLGLLVAGDAAVELQGAVLHRGDRVLVLEDVVRLLEPLLHVASSEGEVMADVGPRHGLELRGDGAHLLVDQGRPLRHGLGDVHDRRELLVLHLDEL